MFERRVQVQGRDGRVHEFVLPDAALPPAPASSTMAMLRLTLPPLAPGERASAAASFFRQSRDASNLVMMLLDPDSWLELERTSRACRAAVLASKCWAGPVAGGHSLRFPPKGRKGAYVRHRRAVWRVARGFQVMTTLCLIQQQYGPSNKKHHFPVQPQHLTCVPKPVVFLIVTCSFLG